MGCQQVHDADRVDKNTEWERKSSSVSFTHFNLEVVIRTSMFDLNYNSRFFQWMLEIILLSEGCLCNRFRSITYLLCDLDILSRNTL